MKKMIATIMLTLLFLGSSVFGASSRASSQIYRTGKGETSFGFSSNVVAYDQDYNLTAPIGLSDSYTLDAFNAESGKYLYFVSSERGKYTLSLDAGVFSHDAYSDVKIGYDLPIERLNGSGNEAATISVAGTDDGKAETIFSDLTVDSYPIAKSFALGDVALIGADTALEGAYSAVLTLTLTSNN